MQKARCAKFIKGFKETLLVACLIVYILMLCVSKTSLAALPFVTDDAAIQDVGQVAIETFTEKWNIPAEKAVEKDKAKLYGQYISASIGVAKNLEFTVGTLVGFDQKSSSMSQSNIIAQVKIKTTEIDNSSKIPGVAIDLGYVTKTGKGEYHDIAENFYAITAVTKNFANENFIVHLNAGAKASYKTNVLDGNIVRAHLGVGVDFSPFQIKKIRLIAESYNGTPNSPRDSPGYFRSYQVGIKIIKSKTLSFHFLYGTQPTFAGYNLSRESFYRKTQWGQFGIRKVFN